MVDCKIITSKDSALSPYKVHEHISDVSKYCTEATPMKVMVN